MAAKSWATTALVMGKDSAAATDDKDNGTASGSFGNWKHTFMHCTKALKAPVDWSCILKYIYSCPSL